ncbi:MAG: AMP-binding protein [Spirochaetaceae bacterium]|jgi:long-chain acyl-CoA synthetase|nr:AMP-binding protein [Spirochaetaceae bacterium]
MLDPKEYMADWQDLPYANFIEWLDGICAKNAAKPAIYFKDYETKAVSTYTYGEVEAAAKRVAKGLAAAGLKKGDRVLLWLENRPQWMFIWLGTVISGCVIVPVDFLVSEAECLSILKFTGAKAAFFSKQKADFQASDEVAALRLSVSRLVSGETFASFGEDCERFAGLPNAREIDSNDACSIVFTSGTTGFAKGVVLSHKGIIANANAAVIMLEPRENDVFINVLPLHHTYPTTCSFISPLSLGISTIIVEKLVGSVVIDNIHHFGGTFLIAVPVLYDKMMAAINAKYQKLPAIIRLPLNLLRSIALKKARAGDPDFGRGVFRFIRKKAGLEHINIMVAGGGALNIKTADFFDSFGFNIVHGYGMSENGPLISVNTPKHKRNESVGLSVKYTTVRIVSQNDENVYLGPGESGEIVVKSPSLMLGYYENAEAAAQMFNAEGFLKTGDLGYMDADGFIYINGRAKNLIVSAGGKNVYPEEIEARFSGSRVVGEILVLGRRSEEYGEYIFAVIVPNNDALAEDWGKKAEDSGFVRELIKKEVEAVNRKLTVYKKISDWMLRTEEFEKNAQKKIRRFLYKDYEDPKKTPIL